MINVLWMLVLLQCLKEKNDISYRNIGNLISLLIHHPNVVWNIVFLFLIRSDLCIYNNSPLTLFSFFNREADSLSLFGVYLNSYICLFFYSMHLGSNLILFLTLDLL